MFHVRTRLSSIFQPFYRVSRLSSSVSDDLLTMFKTCVECQHRKSLPSNIVQNIHMSYFKLTGKELVDFLTAFCKIFGPSPAVLKDKLESSLVNLNQTREDDFYKIYMSSRNDLICPAEIVFNLMLRQSSEGLLLVSKIREDLMRFVKRRDVYCAFEPNKADMKYLINMELILFHLLSQALNSGSVNMNRISFEDTSGLILDKISSYEFIYPIRSFADLKSRVGYGKRCYALFHSILPHEPLAVLYVALLAERCTSLRQINDSCEGERAKYGVFYSITTTHPGLSGIDLGSTLIRELIRLMPKDFPHVHTFETLSPIPRFMEYLAVELKKSGNKLLTANEEIELELLKRDHPHMFSPSSYIHLYGPVVNNQLGQYSSSHQKIPTADFLFMLSNPTNRKDEIAMNFIRPILERACMHYLSEVRTCQVAKFHLSNGATLTRLNWQADPSAKGMERSFGILATYHYNFGKLSDFQKEFENATPKAPIAN